MESELITAKQAADTASVAKSRFLAAASHDFRQPTQAINLFSDALTRTKLSADQRRICDFLSQAVHSLSDMLDVLHFPRMGASKNSGRRLSVGSTR